MEKLKILLIKNDLNFDETHFQQKIKTLAVLQDGKYQNVTKKDISKFFFQTIKFEKA